MVSFINKTDIVTVIEDFDRDFYRNIKDVTYVNKYEKDKMMEGIIFDMEQIHKIHYSIAKYFDKFQSLPGLNVELDTDDWFYLIINIRFDAEKNRITYHLKKEH